MGGSDSESELLLSDLEVITVWAVEFSQFIVYETVVSFTLSEFSLSSGNWHASYEDLYLLAMILDEFSSAWYNV